MYFLLSSIIFLDYISFKGDYGDIGGFGELMI